MTDHTELIARLDPFVQGLGRAILREVDASLEAQAAEIDALQAKLDRVMLEYCPEEMTPEQITEWGKAQQPAQQAPLTSIVSDLVERLGGIEKLESQQAQPERTPLSDAQIDEVIKSVVRPSESELSTRYLIARAIEAAHGIKQGGQHD